MKEELYEKANDIKSEMRKVRETYKAVVEDSFMIQVSPTDQSYATIEVDAASTIDKVALMSFLEEKIEELQKQFNEV